MVVDSKLVLVLQLWLAEHVLAELILTELVLTELVLRHVVHLIDLSLVLHFKIVSREGVLGQEELVVLGGGVVWRRALDVGLVAFSFLNVGVVLGHVLWRGVLQLLGRVERVGIAG